MDLELVPTRNPFAAGCARRPASAPPSPRPSRRAAIVLLEDLHRHPRLAVLPLQQLLGVHEVGVGVVARPDPVDRESEDVGSEASVACGSLFSPVQGRFARRRASPSATSPTPPSSKASASPRRSRCPMSSRACSAAEDGDGRGDQDRARTGWRSASCPGSGAATATARCGSGWAKDEALLLLGRDAIRRGCEQAPDPFAADPEPKKSAMERFQPDALTISRATPSGRTVAASPRRCSTPGSLSTGWPSASATRPSRRPSRYPNASTGRPGTRPSGAPRGGSCSATARRGRGAVTDARELMDKANPPGGGDAELLELYTAAPRALRGRGRGTEPRRPVRRGAGDTETKPCVKSPTGCSRSATRSRSTRCAASPARRRTRKNRRRAAGDDAYLGACLQEAMRLWPTTPMLSREDGGGRELGRRHGPGRERSS